MEQLITSNKQVAKNASDSHNSLGSTKCIGPTTTNRLKSDIQSLKIKKRHADSAFQQLDYIAAENRYKQFLDESATCRELQQSRYLSAINLAESLFWQEKYREAEELTRLWIDKGLKELSPGHELLGLLYQNMGMIMFVANQSGLMFDYMEKALGISIRSNGNNHPNTARALEWLGTMHESISDTTLARKYLYASLSIWKRISKPNDPGMGNICRYIGLYYKRFAKHDSALIFFDKALTAFDKSYGPNNFQSVKCIINKFQVYNHLKNYKTAELLLAQAESRISRSKDMLRAVITMYLFNKSDYFESRGDLLSAIKSVQAIFPLYFKDFNPENILDNPLHVKEIPNHYIKLTLVWKSNFMLKYYEQQPDERIGFLKCAVQCDSLADVIIQETKRHIINYDQALSLGELYSSVYNEMADKAFKLYEKTGKPVYFSQALTYLENNRNLGLFRQTTANGFPAGMEDTLRRIREKYQNEINGYLSLIKSSKSESEKNNLQEKVRDKRIELDKVYYKFSRRDKEITTYFHPQTYIDVQQVQQSLDNKTAIIEYIESCPDYLSVPLDLMIICITKENARMIHGDAKAFYRHFRQYYGGISEKRLDLSDSSTMLLYKDLIEKVESDIKDKSRLLIIPNLYTNLIPFDVLPCSGKFKSATNHFLINKYLIWKDVSLSSFLAADTESGKNGSPLVLAVAPRFKKDIKPLLAKLTLRDTSLVDLPGSRNECISISKMFPTNLMIDYRANKDRFISEAKHYQIIHLSTHSFRSKENEGIMEIAFNPSNSKTNDWLLDNYQILKLQLKASLVVLSSCNSGIGTLYKGEGNLNLAWAFRQAGAKSALISLWEVNDYASSRIIISFYKFLKEGYTKPEALRLAKLEYLTHSFQYLREPAYWAGFEYFGKDEPVIQSSAKQQKTPFFIGILVLILIPCVFFLKTRAKKLSKN